MKKLLGYIYDIVGLGLIWYAFGGISLVLYLTVLWIVLSAIYKFDRRKDVITEVSSSEFGGGSKACN